MKKTPKILSNVIVLAIAAGCAFSLMTYFGKSFLVESPSVDAPLTAIKRPLSIKMTAIGDSLTEGIGDSTHTGGYVSAVIRKLRGSSSVRTAEADNYGISGNTSVQIKKRIVENEDIQNSLLSSNVISVTAGGNDLIHVIRKSGFKADNRYAEKVIEDYRNNLISLIKEIRKVNADSPIYFFGIYNPYAEQLKEITFLQNLVNEWNNTAEITVESFPNCYFLPISDLFRSSNTVVEGNEISTTQNTNTNENPYLFQEDYFHPNEKGYELMAEKLATVILEQIETEKGEDKNK